MRSEADLSIALPLLARAIRQYGFRELTDEEFPELSSGKGMRTLLFISPLNSSVRMQDIMEYSLASVTQDLLVTAEYQLFMTMPLLRELAEITGPDTYRIAPSRAMTEIIRMKLYQLHDDAESFTWLRKAGSERAERTVDIAFLLHAIYGNAHAYYTDDQGRKRLNKRVTMYWTALAFFADSITLAD